MLTHPVSADSERLGVGPGGIRVTGRAGHVSEGPLWQKTATTQREQVDAMYSELTLTGVPVFAGTRQPRCRRDVAPRVPVEAGPGADEGSSRDGGACVMGSGAYLAFSGWP